MRRLSIARSVQLSLLGLALLLTILAGLGIADLYRSRQRYEDRVAATYGLESAAAKLFAASVVEEATDRTAPAGAPGVPIRASARRSFRATARQTLALAAADPLSARLVSAAIGAQSAVRHGNPSAVAGVRVPLAALVSRQSARRAQARSTARDDSRHALIEVIAAGGLAFVVALALVSSLIARMRRPLSELVSGAQSLERGDLAARVHPDGPAELRTLGVAFNDMAGKLASVAADLEAERSRLEQTIESLGDALIVVDADGTVAAANPRAEQLLAELAPGSDAAAAGVLPKLDDALRGEVVVEHAGRTLAATAAHVSDGAGGVVWTVRDVSERARLERLKSEFVATASHELRSPMTSIKGFVELLSAGENLDARQREFVEIILVSTNRLVDLVNDLLDVARIEAGAVEIHRRPLDLAEVVEEVATLMRPRLEDKLQDLSLEIEPQLPRALADPTRIRQVLTNLLTNAHLYTPAGGSLAIRLYRRGEAVAMEVADDGPGMGPEQLERIFERFYRDRGEQSISGTGLGLAIVKSLVDMHEGTIEVASEPGAGSTFTVLLPQAPPRSAVTDAQAALAGKRVLVIDDEPAVGRLIATQLGQFGIDCVTVASGAEGIALLRRVPFDAVTLDILMPEMSGFDVLHELRSDPQLRELPVVVVSVFSGREALAGEWVVDKPIDAEELIEALGSAFVAGRVRVLVVARAQLREEVEEQLVVAGVPYLVASGEDEVRELCASHRFEAALVDAGLDDPAGAIAALDLRGTRSTPAVLVFASEPDGAGGLARFGAELVELDNAGATLAQLLQIGVGGAESGE